MKKILSIAPGVVGLAPPSSGTVARSAQTARALHFAFASIEGSPMPLEQFRGKVLLVVNTASFCGFTPQYEGLEELWQENRDRGLVVIGVPSNDFAEQEPKAEAEISQFCKARFGV